MARLTIEKINGKFRIGNGIPMSGEIFIGEMYKFANSPDSPEVGERRIPVQPAMPVVFSRYRIQPEILARFREIAKAYPHARIAKKLGTSGFNIKNWSENLSWDGGNQSAEFLRKMSEFVANFNESDLYTLTEETLTEFIRISTKHSYVSVAKKVGMGYSRVRTWAISRPEKPYISSEVAKRIRSFVQNYDKNDPELRPTGHRYVSQVKSCTPVKAKV